MLHKYEKKPKVRRKATKIPTHVIQVAAPPFLWQMPHSCAMLRAAFFASYNHTQKMRLDRDIEQLLSKKIDTTGFTIFRQEDLDEKTVQDNA